MPFELLIEEAQAELERQADSIEQAWRADEAALTRLLNKWGSGFIQERIADWEMTILGGDPPKPKSECFFWNEANSAGLVSESDCW